MAFRTLLKAIPTATPNRFEYQAQVAIRSDLKSDVMDEHFLRMKEYLIHNNPDDNYLGLLLENLDKTFDDEQIGRLVNTRMLMELIQTDEFETDPLDVWLLLGDVQVNHYLYFDDNVITDIGLEEVELKWTIADFAEHYTDALWRINN
jgi:hypothetical protein